MTRCELIRCWIKEDEGSNIHTPLRGKCTFHLEDVTCWEEYVAGEWKDSIERTWIHLGDRTAVFEIDYDRFNEIMTTFQDDQEVEDRGMKFYMYPN